MSDGVSQMEIEREALENALKALIPFGAKVEVNYHDYEKNQWTVPSILTEVKARELSRDFSISYIRITLEG